MTVTAHAPGNFCWVELGTTDGEDAKRFYSRLFGWTPNDHDMGEGMVYTMLQKDGKDVGALYKDTMSGAPPHWQSYVSVSSADESGAKAESLGAKIIMGPLDVMDVGRMAVIQDPQGAVFSIWQPKSHIGYQVLDEPNSVCWNELVTKGRDAAVTFYTGLFGWSTMDHGPDYVMFTNNGKPVAGAMEITAEMAHVPPWTPYFQVTDPDGYASRATELGGGAVVPPQDIPQVGRFSIIRDAQNAVFGIIRLGAP